MGILYLYGGFHRHGDPQKWMVYFMENPISMDDSGVAVFQETSIYVRMIFNL